MSEHNFSPSKPLDRRIIVITAILASGNLSICLHRSSRVYLLQQSQCLEFYSYHDAAKIGADSMVDERLCKIKDVQSVLSVLEGVDGFCAVLPGKFCCVGKDGIILAVRFIRAFSRLSMLKAEEAIPC